MSRLQFALREIRHRLDRTVAIVSTVALAVGMSLTVYLLSDAYLDALALPFRNLGSDLVIQRELGAGTPSQAGQEAFLPGEAQPFTPEELAAIHQAPGVKETAASMLFWSAHEGTMRLVIGVDPVATFGAGALREHVKAGRFFQPGETGRAIVDEHYAVFYAVKVGESSVLVGGRRFEIIGIARPPVSGNLSAAGIFIPLADAQALLGLPASVVNTVDIQVSQPAAVEPIRTALQERIPGLRLTSAQSSLAASSSVTGYAARFGRLLMGLIVGLAVLIIYLTVNGSVRDRSVQIAVLKALGWTAADLRRQLGLEMLLQSIVGGLVGLGLALLSITELRSIRIEDRQAAQWISGISGADGFHGHVPAVGLSLEFHWLPAVAAVILGSLLALLVMLVATQRLTTLKPTVLLGRHR